MGKGVCCVTITAGKGAYDRQVMLGSWGFQNWITNWLIIWDLFCWYVQNKPKKRAGIQYIQYGLRYFHFWPWVISKMWNPEPQIMVWVWSSLQRMLIFGIDVSIAISQWCEVVVPRNDCIPLWRLENASAFIYIHVYIYIYICIYCKFKGYRPCRRPLSWAIWLRDAT